MIPGAASTQTLRDTPLAKGARAHNGVMIAVVRVPNDVLGPVADTSASSTV